MIAHLLMVMAIGIEASATAENAFTMAADSATARTVKLYGLGAGVQEGYGSGVLISPDGMVLTVLSLLVDSRNPKAVTARGTKYEVEVIGRDPKRHLALLRLKFDPQQPQDLPWFDAATGLPMSPGGEVTGESSTPDVQPGAWSVAAGTAFKVAEGAEQVSITHGVFSTRTKLDARRRVREFPYHGDVLVFDAITSNPGAPGGAVVDLHGRLVGIIGRDVISNQTHTHFNYAIPRDILAAYVAEARAESTSPPSTAAQPSQSSPVIDVDYGIRLTRAGFRKVLPFVDRVKIGSPAAKAGIAADDLILSVNGKNVADVAEYNERLRDLAPGTPLDLVIRRGRAIISVRVEAPSP